MIVSLLLLVLILYFCSRTIIYIRKRLFIKNTIESLKKSADKEENKDVYPDLDTWIDENKNKLGRENYDSQRCKDIAIEISNHQSCDNNTLGCDLKRIDIPSSTNATFYTFNGTLLLPGHSYCVYKQPPIINSNYECDERWGFWRFSHKYERWMCESRMPGIYNAATNSFNDPCQNGQLMFDNKPFMKSNIDKIFHPQQFYSINFQNRFSCKCDKGYIFQPEKSRTKCFKDPCLIGLPKGAVAKGFNPETGNCDCGEYFYNINGNQSFPCTSCPTNNPQYDKDNHTLTLFLKCSNEDEKNTIPCKTDEEKITGCIKVKLKVKAMNDDNASFEDRIFF